jgi:predicted naringenin-chalcone synthase
MFLQSIATAIPPDAFSQRECWEAICRSQVQARLKDRSLTLLKKILLGDSGIATRRFALNDLDRIFDYNSDDLILAFEREAPRLARDALGAAMEKAALLPHEIDALFICTCTGYLCPGVSSHVAEQRGLRQDIYLHDGVGLGCGAAIPTLRAASHFLAAHPGAKVACVAVEICSAAFYLDDEPGVLISACLFGDGAAATIWTGRPQNGEPRAFGFDTLHLPEQRELLRFETRGGQLRNRLAKTVPATAAGAVHRLFQRLGSRPVQQVIAHPGGRDVIAALQETLPGRDLRESRRVLREFGNMSSPSVLFALEEFLKHQSVEEDIWLVSFGAGFSCHGCRIGHAAPG